MPETKNLPKIPLVIEKSQARLSSFLLKSDPSAAIACDGGENTSTQELKNEFLDRNQLTKIQKVESRVVLSFTLDLSPIFNC